MLEFLSNLLIGIGNLLNLLLPDSLASQILTGPTVLKDGIEWLNWVFPVMQCLVLLSTELGLVVTYVAVRMVMSKAITVGEKLVG